MLNVQHGWRYRFRRLNTFLILQAIQIIYNNRRAYRIPAATTLKTFYLSIIPGLFRWQVFLFYTSFKNFNICRCPVIYANRFTSHAPTSPSRLVPDICPSLLARTSWLRLLSPGPLGFYIFSSFLYVKKKLVIQKTGVNYRIYVCALYVLVKL